MNLALFVLHGNLVRRLWHHARDCQSSSCSGQFDDLYHLINIILGAHCWSDNDANSDDPEIRCSLSEPITIVCIFVSIIGMSFQIIMGVLIIISMGEFF